MKDILPLIKVTDALYESIYCIVNLDKVGTYRYQESKKQLNGALEDLIDCLKDEKK